MVGGPGGRRLRLDLLSGEGTADLPVNPAATLLIITLIQASRGAGYYGIKEYLFFVGTSVFSCGVCIIHDCHVMAS